MSEATSAISYEKEGDVTIVRFAQEEIRDAEYSRQASEELRQLAERFGGNMLISLANIHDMSSIGIAVLLTFRKHLRGQNGRLKICEMQPLVLGILTSSSLDKALECHASKEEAMAAFQNAP